jgi:poly-gamma-glutamate capsule biosynthesis protein CapA/YwtB (metallophosphatase superfamily)
VAWSGEDDQVIEDIIAARTVHHADIVIPYMHWGWEEEAQPSPRLREFARRMIDAGADMVVGGHPHVTQGAETYKGKPIIYSLGNFLFNGFDTEATTTGWVLSVRWVARACANGARTWPGSMPTACRIPPSMPPALRCAGDPAVRQCKGMP